MVSLSGASCPDSFDLLHHTFLELDHCCLSGLLSHAPRSCQYLIAEDLEGSSVHQLVGQNSALTSSTQDVPIHGCLLGISHWDNLVLDDT